MVVRRQYVAYRKINKSFVVDFAIGAYLLAKLRSSDITYNYYSKSCPTLVSACFNITMNSKSSCSVVEGHCDVSLSKTHIPHCFGIKTRKC